MGEADSFFYFALVVGTLEMMHDIVGYGVVHATSTPAGRGSPSYRAAP